MSWLAHQTASGTLFDEDMPAGWNGEFLREFERRRHEPCAGTTTDVRPNAAGGFELRLRVRLAGGDLTAVASFQSTGVPDLAAPVVVS